MSCENDYNCDARRSCLPFNASISTCVCSPFQGYGGEDCSDFTTAHIIYFLILVGPKMVFELAMLFRLIFHDRRSFISAKFKKSSTTAIARRLLIFAISLMVLGAITEIVVYFTPEGYKGKNVVHFDRRQDQRTQYPLFVGLASMAIVIFLNCQVALIWIENAKKLEALDPSLNTRISTLIKRIIIGYFVTGLVIFGCLVIFELLVLIPVLIPFYCFLVVVIVHWYCSKQFLSALVMFSESYVDSIPYKMVKRLSKTVMLSFGLVTFGGVLYLIEIYNPDFFEKQKPFTAGYLPIQISTIGTLLNQYGLYVYISSSINGRALFEASQAKIFKNHSHSSVPRIQQPVGAYKGDLA